MMRRLPLVLGTALFVVAGLGQASREDTDYEGLSPFHGGGAPEDAGIAATNDGRARNPDGGLGPGGDEQPPGFQEPSDVRAPGDEEGAPYVGDDGRDEGDGRGSYQVGPGDEQRFAEVRDAPAPITSEGDIERLRNEGKSEKDIGRQVLRDHVRAGKEKQFNDAFEKEKQGLEKEGEAAEAEAKAVFSRSKDEMAQAKAAIARKSPEERAAMMRTGMDPTAPARVMEQQAGAMITQVQNKNKAERELLESKKPGLQEEGRKQADREAGDEVNNVPIKSPEDILKAVQADRQAQFLDSVTPVSLREAEVELSSLFSGVLSSVITNMLTKKPELVRKHMNVQFRPESQAPLPSQQAQAREL